MTDHVVRLYALGRIRARTVPRLGRDRGAALAAGHARGNLSRLDTYEQRLRRDAALVARIAARRRAWAAAPAIRVGDTAAADDNPHVVMLRAASRRWAPRSSSCSTRTTPGARSTTRRRSSAARRCFRFRPDLELSRLNRAGTLRVGPELLELAGLATTARERTRGRFDPTVHDALRRAGYDHSFELVEASPAPSAGTPHRCGGRVAVDPSSGYVTLETGFRLDLGGIAKGWAADRGACASPPHGACARQRRRRRGGSGAARPGRPRETPEGTITLSRGGARHGAAATAVAGCRTARSVTT